MTAIAALLFVSLAIGDMCTTGPVTCAQCKNMGPTCGWCAATQTCLEGTQNQPLMSKCVGRGQWMFQSCPSCSQFNGDCRSCTLSNRDCQWCDQQKTCLELSDASCPMPATTSCPCSTYQSCASCTVFSDGVCGWCAKSSDCQSMANPGANCGAIATTCPCSANKNCDSCMLDFNGFNNGGNGNCQWCNDTCLNQGDPKCTLAALNCPASCETHSSCDSCQRHGCAWCNDGSGCVDASSATCLVAHLCPEHHCDRFGECDTCDEQRGRGCLWCSDLSQCVHSNETIAQTCLKQRCSDLCSAKKTCPECHAIGGCGWCLNGEEAVCVNTGFHSCANKTQCHFKPDEPGFATGTFFLGWLVFALILAVLGGAFYVYKRRGGRKVYTAI